MQNTVVQSECGPLLKCNIFPCLFKDIRRESAKEKCPQEKPAKLCWRWREPGIECGTSSPNQALCKEVNVKAWNGRLKEVTLLLLSFSFLSNQWVVCSTPYGSLIAYHKATLFGYCPQNPTSQQSRNTKVELPSQKLPSTMAAPVTIGQ